MVQAHPPGTLREAPSRGEARDALRAQRERRRVDQARLRGRPRRALGGQPRRRRPAHQRARGFRGGVSRAIREASPAVRHHRRHGGVGRQRGVDHRQSQSSLRRPPIQSRLRRRRLRRPSQVRPHPPLPHRPRARARRFPPVHLRREFRRQGRQQTPPRRLRRPRVFQGGSLRDRGREAKAAVPMGGHRPSSKRQQRPRGSPRDERVERPHQRAQALVSVPPDARLDQGEVETQGRRTRRRIRDVVPEDVPPRAVPRVVRPAPDGLRATPRGDHVRPGRVVARGAQPRSHGGGDAKRRRVVAVRQGVAHDPSRSTEDERAVARETPREAPGPRLDRGRAAAQGRILRGRGDVELEQLVQFGGIVGHGGRVRLREGRRHRGETGGDG